MAITTVLKGTGNVTVADSTTGWNAFKISGTGGSPSAAIADGQIEGTGAVTCVTSKQRVVLYFDIGVGNELDFTAGGAQAGEMVMVWAQMLASSLLNVQSVGGFGTFLSSGVPSTSDYHLWYQYGSDNYSGGWKRMVFDPNDGADASSESAGAGVLDLTAVRYFGVFADVGGATARFDNLVCDAIDVGTGLRVFGTTTAAGLAADLLVDEKLNRFGIFTALNDAETSFELAGELELGDNIGTNAATLADEDSKIFMAKHTYHNGTIVTNSAPLSLMKILCVGNATGATSITIGQKVGVGDTAQGRNGWTIVGNDTYTPNIVFDDGNVNVCKWYGSSLELITGLLSWGTNTAHECIGNSFNGCTQFDPIGGIIIRACSFVNYIGVGGSVLWNESINIISCKFLNNTNASNATGIEHPSNVGTPYSYDNLTFSGNDADINNTAGGALTVNAINGSNPTTSQGSAVTINNAVVVKIIVKSLTTGLALVGARVLVVKDIGGAVVLSGVTDALGVIQDAGYNYTVDEGVNGHVRMSSTAPYYKEGSIIGTITTSGLDITVQLADD